MSSYMWNIVQYTRYIPWIYDFMGIPDGASQGLPEVSLRRDFMSAKSQGPAPCSGLLSPASRLSPPTPSAAAAAAAAAAADSSG